MAFLQEKDRAGGAHGEERRGEQSRAEQSRAEQSSGPQRMAFLSSVSGWCPAYVPTTAPAAKGLLKAGDPQCRVQRKMFQETSQERASKIPFQIWHQSCADLSKTGCITDLWDLEQRLKNLGRSEKCFGVDFQKLMTSFPPWRCCKNTFPCVNLLLPLLIPENSSKARPSGGKLLNSQKPHIN